MKGAKMTELYRGLLLVITNKFHELILSFRTHIQSFNTETKDPDNYMDVGVMGFWNLMLEIILTVFSLLCLVGGVSLIACLAIAFYPLEALLKYSSLLLSNTRNPNPDLIIPNKEKIPPVIDDEENPKIVKKEK